ncbi:MAG: GNAT family N-acetyltransferase [Anaerolineales bacterium]|nr:GNAT family N-acetyltransferase [Anaerolineales bacterium]
MVEQLQLRVWPGSELDVVPLHMLMAAIHAGGLLIGAVAHEDSDEPTNPNTSGRLAGFVLGFPGVYPTPDGPRLKHYSHMLGVDPAFRNQGIGFKLKRAQWQMVRRQGIDRITWTYDPLLSPNAWLNITRLGAVCNTYLVNFYGRMRDALNMGLDSDRFEVDWWVNTRRVYHRLSHEARPALTLQHYMAAETPLVHEAHWGSDRYPEPGKTSLPDPVDPQPLLLLEIPADFSALRQADVHLAQAWRLHTRQLFLSLFDLGYIVTDFVTTNDELPQSFYVLSHGEAQIGGVTHDSF